MATSALRSRTTVTGGNVEFADVSPDGTRFVTVADGNDNTVAVWRPGEARPTLSLRHRLGVTSAEFDPTGARIVTHEFRQSFHVGAADMGREVCPPIKSDDDYFRPDRARFDRAGRRLALARHQTGKRGEAP